MPEDQQNMADELLNLRRRCAQLEAEKQKLQEEATAANERAGVQGGKYEALRELFGLYLDKVFDAALR